MNQRNQNPTVPDELPRPDLVALRRRLENIAITQTNFERLEQLLRSDAPDKWQKASKFARKNGIAIAEEPTLLQLWEEYYVSYLRERMNEGLASLQSIQDSCRMAQERNEEFRTILNTSEVLAHEASCWRRIAEVNRLLAAGQIDPARVVLEALQQEVLMLPEEGQEKFRRLYETLHLDFGRAVEAPSVSADRVTGSVAQSHYQQQLPALAKSFRQGRFAELVGHLENVRQAIENNPTGSAFDRELCLELLAEWGRRVDQARAFGDLLERTERALLPATNASNQPRKGELGARGLLDRLFSRPDPAPRPEPPAAGGYTFDARLWRRIRLEILREQLDSALNLAAPEVLAVNNPVNARSLAECWHELLRRVVNDILTLLAADAPPDPGLDHQWQAYLEHRQRDAEERRQQGQRRLEAWLSSSGTAGTISTGSPVAHSSSPPARESPYSTGDSAGTPTSPSPQPLSPLLPKSPPATAVDLAGPTRATQSLLPLATEVPAGRPADIPSPYRPTSPPEPDESAISPRGPLDWDEYKRHPVSGAGASTVRLTIVSNATKLKAGGIEEARLNISLDGIHFGGVHKVRVACQRGEIYQLQGIARSKQLDIIVAPGLSSTIFYSTSTQSGADVITAWLLADDDELASSETTLTIEVI